jgi:hypothetical protein
MASTKGSKQPDNIFDTREEKRSSWLNCSRLTKIIFGVLLLGIAATTLGLVGQLVFLSDNPSTSAPSPPPPVVLMGKPSQSPPSPPLPTPRQEVSVDYLVGGGGPAGLQTAVDLSQALRNIGVPATQVSISVVEKRSVFGGNIRKIALKKPPNYDNSYGPLQGDVGAQRVNVLTLTNQRRLFLEHNITMYCTPFRNIINLRGRREICRTPREQAHTSQPYYDCSFVDDNSPLDCIIDPADAFSYGDFCSYRSTFSDPVTGAYRGVRTGANTSGCSNYDNTESGICDNFGNNDPGYDAYQWLLQDNVPPAFDAEISSTLSPRAMDFNFCTGTPKVHPLTGEGCVNGVNCPAQRAGQYVDYRTFVAAELSTDPNREILNQDYANFMEGDNVGFTGDFHQGFGARSYTNYQSREWNTASHSCYPKGGMMSLIDAMVTKAQANGVKLYANEGIKSINKSTRPGVLYEVATATKLFLVKKFLFGAIPTPTLENRGEITGNVMTALDAKREFHRARAQEVASITMQWPPGKPAWFWNLFDENGNYSVRQYGDTGCFSRIELIDTPAHRCHNGIKAVYADFRCRQMYRDLLERAKKTNDWTNVTNRVLAELRTAFPNETIPAPIFTYGEMINPAWYWGKPEYDDISNEDHAIWATKPLGLTENLCLTSESVHIYYQGWTEGALRSSRQCLVSRMSGSIKTALNAIYAARDNLVPGDGTWNSQNFQDIPDAIGVKHFANEVWWPYDYSNPQLGSDSKYCKSSLVGLTNYPTQVNAAEDDFLYDPVNDC